MAAKKAPVVSNASLALKNARAAILKTTNHKPLGAEEKQWPHIPTGSIVIDDLIGGSMGKDGKPVCPGIPRRRISEVFGPESSGKTTLALSVVTNTQKAGGSVLYLDYEHALHIGYAKALGVSFDENQLNLFTPDTLEEGFKMMLLGIMFGVDLIVVDSVAAMVPSGELAKDMSDPARVGAMSSLMSQHLPKFANWLATFPRVGGKEGPTDKTKPGTALLLLNQERATIATGGGGYGTPDPNTSGGKALKFYASLRLRVQKIKTETIEQVDVFTKKKIKRPYGTMTLVKVIKDKLDGRQGHTGTIFIRYGQGIDNYHSIIESAVSNDLMKKEGSFYTLDNERFRGRDQCRKYLIENPKKYAELEKLVRRVILESAKPILDSDVDPNTSVINDIEDEFGPSEGISFDTLGSALEEEVIEEVVE